MTNASSLFVYHKLQNVNDTYAYMLANSVLIYTQCLGLEQSWLRLLKEF